MATRQGSYTLKLDNSPSVVGFASIGSKKESEGPMAPYMDILNTDSFFGQTSWEKAESQMQVQVSEKALEKAKLTMGDIQMAFAGDLLNQCIASSYALNGLGVPFAGLYGACSTMAESLAMASCFVETGLAGHALAMTSSHFCSAERQYRFPLAYGGLRTPSSQWTVTGGGCAVVGPKAGPPYIRAVTFGAVEDKGIKDINNMGAAMAPAAVRTLYRFFQDTATTPDNYDLILTGDLAQVGSALFERLMEREGYPLGKKHADCGLLIYDRERQKAEAGGSGCGCSGSVLCGYIMRSISQSKLQNVLFIATGALMSPVSIQQGQSIPAVAHLVYLSSAPS